jgi:hypothetical protein
MTKRRTGRKKKPASSGKPGLERKLLEIFGKPDRASLAREALKGSSRAKLLSASRLLGLTGISRLRKDELVDRLWHALQVFESPRAKENAPPTTPEEVPSTVEHAGRSRADFEAHKYSLTDREASSAGPRESSPPKYIPWSYGRDRVRALPIDPERLYVYWEVTDEGRESARGKLGAGASTAWLNLRVYDTTGRLFDGTNAHSYFDHRVDNGSRQWFFDIGKAGSEAFVEIGMKSHEGYFVRIARSGRVVFPRRSPAPYREPQWLTVRASAPEAPVVTKRGAGRAFESTPQRHIPPGPAPRPVYVPAEESQGIEPPVRETEARPTSVALRDEREIERRWEAPVTVRVWEAGPFTLPGHAPEPVSETYVYEASTFEVDGRTHMVFGPWQMVVRGLGAFEERRVLSRWMVYRSWAVEGGSEAPLGVFGERMLGSSALLGGSERRLRGASELRLAGASELLYRGASERRVGGASERIFGAASERRYVAASEKLFRGASERRLGGASGRR